MSLNGNMDWKPNENLLALSNRYEKGILISSNLGSNVVGLHREFLPKDTRALMCMPIRASYANTYPVTDERRKI